MLTFSLKNKTFAQNVPWYLDRGRRGLQNCLVSGSLFSSKDNEENVNARWLTWAASLLVLKMLAG
jgi:hypothetical protein